MEDVKPTAEELAIEGEALKPIDADAIRTSIVEELGLDETTDSERIDKIVAREVKNREINQGAIKAKITQRTEKEKALADKAVAETKAAGAKPGSSPEEVSKLVSAELEKRDLEALDLPDDLKATVKKVASTQGISIKEALKDDYVKSKVDTYHKQQESENAAAGRTHRGGGGGGSAKKLSINNPPEVNLATPEGRKAYDEWKDQLKQAEARGESIL